MMLVLYHHVRCSTGLEITDFHLCFGLEVWNTQSFSSVYINVVNSGLLPRIHKQMCPSCKKFYGLIKAKSEMVQLWSDLQGEVNT